MKQSFHCVLFLLATASQWALAQTETKKPDTLPKPEVVLTGLDNPTGVAIQPTSGIVYVANSAAGEALSRLNRVRT